jgi:hypothetical protein
MVDEGAELLKLDLAPNDFCGVVVDVRRSNGEPTGSRPSSTSASAWGGTGSGPVPSRSSRGRPQWRAGLVFDTSSLLGHNQRVRNLRAGEGDLLLGWRQEHAQATEVDASKKEILRACLCRWK